MFTVFQPSIFNLEIPTLIFSEREDERLAREVFTTYLTENLGNTEFEIKDGDEPPDYWLRINRAKYALEVTQVVETIEGGKEEISFDCYIQSQHKLSREIEKRAKNQEILSGHYFINFNGNPKYNPRKHNSDLIVGALRYIEKNKHSKESLSEIIFREVDSSISIIKCPGDDDFVSPGLLGSPGGGLISRWIKNLSEKIVESLNRKQLKLTRLKSQTEGSILLVINRFWCLRPGEDLELLFKYLRDENMDFYKGIYLTQMDRMLTPLKEAEF